MIRDAIEHVLWDWNGTLLNDVEYSVRVMNGVLRRRGIEAICARRHRDTFTFPVKHYYAALGFDVASPDFEAASREFIRHYYDGVHACELHAHGREALALLAARGLRQSVLSASERAALLPVLERYALTAHFEHVLGLDDHYAHGKAEIGAAWLREQGVNPRAVLLIGDTVHDAEVAREMGIACVLVSHGHHSRERLAACGFPVVDDLRAIVTRSSD